MTPRVAWIFYKKSSFNEQDCAWVLIFAGGLITFSLFINKDVAPGRGRSEVTSLAGVEQKGGDCSDNGVL